MQHKITEVALRHLVQLGFDSVQLTHTCALCARARSPCILLTGTLNNYDYLSARAHPRGSEEHAIYKYEIVDLRQHTLAPKADRACPARNSPNIGGESVHQFFYRGWEGQLPCICNEQKQGRAGCIACEPAALDPMK